MSASARSSPRIFRRSSARTATSRWTRDVVTAKFAALAEEIAARHRRRRARRSEVAEGFLQIAVANMANAIKQVSVQKGHDATRFALQCFGGAGGQHACLVADALGHGDGVHPSLRRRAVGLWHGPRRPDGDARAGGGDAARAPTRCRNWTRWPTGWRVDAGAALAAPGRRSGADHHAAQPASALCRHRGGADRAVARPSTGSSRTSPRRTAPASASPRPIGRWSSRRWRWKRPRRARRCAEAHAAGPREPARRRRSTACACSPADADARRAGVRPHRAAGRRSHRRPGADPRGQRHHRGRARLDGRGHAAATT